MSDADMLYVDAHGGARGTDFNTVQHTGPRS